MGLHLCGLSQVTVVPGHCHTVEAVGFFGAACMWLEVSRATPLPLHRHLRHQCEGRDSGN